MDYPIEYILDVIDELRDLGLSEPTLAEVAHKLCD